MLTRRILLNPNITQIEFDRLCDMLRAADLYLDHGTDADNHFWVTVQFLNRKHYRIFCKRMYATNK